PPRAPVRKQGRRAWRPEPRVMSAPSWRRRRRRAPELRRPVERPCRRSLDPRQTDLFAAPRIAGEPDPEAELDRQIWRSLPVDLPRGRMVLELLRACGGDAWLYPTPDVIQFDAPRTLPTKLRDLLFLHGYMSAKAISVLLVEEEDANG